MIKILLVDDHIGVAQGTKAILEKGNRIQVEVLSDSQEALTYVQQSEYDLVLLDLYMPELNGMELSKLILHSFPHQKIMIYTGFDIAVHFNMLVDIGICGFISKSLTEEQIVQAIECAVRGETVIPTCLFKQLRRTEAFTVGIAPEKVEETIRDITLNEREQDILAGVAEGMTNKELSSRMLISQRAVEYILTGLYNKLGVKSRTEALIKANRHSLLSLKTI